MPTFTQSMRGLSADIDVTVQEISKDLESQVTIDAIETGHSNNVVFISSCDNRWVLRMAKHDFAAALSKRGALILKHIKVQQPELQVPSIIRQGDSYILLEYMRGNALRIWNHQTLNKDLRRSLLRSLGSFLFNLWTCPSSPLESGPFCSYREWLYNEVDKGICRSIESDGAWGDPLDFLARRLRVHELAADHVEAPYMIKHGDINACNVLTTKELISGVIDWDTAQFVPPPAAVQHPLFLADIPGWLNDGVSKGMTFEEDRKYLESTILALEQKSDSICAQKLHDLLASSFDRQFFEMSLRNRRINKEYIASYSQDSAADFRIMLFELDLFLSKNPTLREHPAVSDMRHRLST